MRTLYTLIAVTTVFILLIFVFGLYARKYGNPYKLVMIFGKKGSGKTTLLVKMAYKFLKTHNGDIYTNCEINLPMYANRIFSFNPKELGGTFFPPPGSALFVDEVGMIWDNRHYKEFKDYQRDYFKLQRQYKNYVYLFSQTFDIDIKLRNLCDRMYMCKCHFNVLSVARRINRILVIVEPDGESESRIADSLQFEPLLFQLFGTHAIYCTWIPHWTKFFDTNYMAKGLADSSAATAEDEGEETPADSDFDFTTD